MRPNQYAAATPAGPEPGPPSANRIIKAVKRQGFGYTNADNYRLRVLYRCA